jgi:hypothetical protein
VKKLKFILLFLIIPFVLKAQTTGKISGKVIDEKGEPLIGANVIIEGTSIGAAVDLDGSYFIINVPVGRYSLRASSIGYTAQKVENVKVIGGLTTKIDFQLSSSTVEMKEIIVQQTRPPVQKDLTSKMQSIEFRDLQNLPVKGTVRDLLTKQAGITADIATIPINSQPVFGQFATIPNDGLHFRGGRTNETLYLFDGIVVNDALWGGYNLDVLGEYTLYSIQTLTGNFGPQYGEAMSGVLQLQTVDNVSKELKVDVTSYTDNFGKDSGTQKVYNFESAINLPILDNLSLFANFRGYQSDGYLNGYLYPEWVDSRGFDKTGNPEEVPMAYRDNLFYFGKLIWQASEHTKLRVGFYNSDSKQGVYDHFFKYNPYGTPHVILNDKLLYLKYTQILSQSTYFDLAVSKYTRDFKSRVFDNPSFYEIRPELLIAEFSVSGENFVYFDSYFDKLELQGSFSSQITKQHFINLGFSLSNLRTELKRINPNGWQVIEDYDYKPIKYNLFINDKMEFDDIGMVINLGLRYDFIDPNRDYILDIKSPDGGIGKVQTRNYLSPRIGISYPISDVAAFRFGYGIYYQYPDFFKTFQGMNRSYPLYPQPDVNNVSGAIASGNIEEEKTVNYEVGVQLKMSDDFSADITGFYRKTSNLIGVIITDGLIVSGDVEKTQRYPTFSNVNFATVKGIEVSLVKRMSNNFSGFLNYTFSEALVTSSLLFSQPRDLTRTFPADWDQSHTVAAGATFDFSGNWGFSLLGSASSGLPYTYNVFQPNAERAPFISSFDALVYKEFEFWKINLRIYAQAINLLNRKNVWWVYPDSGKPGVDTNPATSDDYTNNPAMWGPGRRFQIGFSFSY